MRKGQTVAEVSAPVGWQLAPCKIVGTVNGCYRVKLTADRAPWKRGEELVKLPRHVGTVTRAWKYGVSWQEMPPVKA